MGIHSSSVEYGEAGGLGRAGKRGGVPQEAEEHTEHESLRMQALHNRHVSIQLMLSF